MPASAPGRDSCCDVPDNESGGIHPVQCDSGRRISVAAPGNLGGDIYEELSDGVLLEYVRCCSIYPLDFYKDFPGEVMNWRDGIRRSEALSRPPSPQNTFQKSPLFSDVLHTEVSEFYSCSYIDIYILQV